MTQADMSKSDVVGLVSGDIQTSQPKHTIAARQSLRDQIQRDVDEFIASGGKIDIVPIFHRTKEEVSRHTVVQTMNLDKDRYDRYQWQQKHSKMGRGQNQHTVR